MNSKWDKEDIKRETKILIQMEIETQQKYQADNSEKEVYKINACIKKKRKISNKQINFIPQGTKKRTN